MRGTSIYWGFLHVRGGVSEESGKFKVIYRFSPRSWRCFRERLAKELNAEVFSTFVEVFLAGQKV